MRRLTAPFKLGNVNLKTELSCPYLHGPWRRGVPEKSCHRRGGTAMIIIDVPVLKSPFLSLQQPERISVTAGSRKRFDENGALAAAQSYVL